MALAAPGVLSACLDQTTFVQPPPPGSAGDTTSGTVQRAALVVTVAVAGTDTALAGRIGSFGGLLAQAAVTIEREGAAATRQSDTTDAAGAVTFVGLLPGRYRVTVLRVLTEGEIARFDSADADVFAFGGGGAVDVQAPQAAAAVQAYAGRRGSLVISEMFFGRPLVAGWIYNFAGYLELYNNSDTTIYLDGKLVGVGPRYIRDRPNALNNPYSCQDYAYLQLDPEGMWSYYVWRIPGSGQDHPLAPGEAVVLATDAIDHRPVDPRLPDLSRADFEFIGSNDADNPGVPNLVSEGWDFIGGHGLTVGATEIVYVADAVDLAVLPTLILPLVNKPAWRVPRASILDVIASSYTPEIEVNFADSPLCQPWISPIFDQQPGKFLAEQTVHSARRRVFMTLPDGRVILLRTKATANDFEIVGAATPGVVP